MKKSSPLLHAFIMLYFYTDHMKEVGRVNKNFSSAKTLGICLGVIALAVVAVTICNVSVGILFFAGALLLCPLIHVWMMKDGGHKQ